MQKGSWRDYTWSEKNSKGWYTTGRFSALGDRHGKRAMNDNQLVAIIAGLAVLGAALVSGIAALVGVRLGRYMERDNEKMKWRRERCLESYADLFAACDVLLLEAGFAALLCDPNDKATIEQNGKVLNGIMEMLRVHDKASLVGSAEANKAMRRLTDYYHLKAADRAVNWPKPSTKEWDTIVAQAANLYGEALKAARKELGTDGII